MNMLISTKPTCFINFKFFIVIFGVVKDFSIFLKIPTTIFSLNVFHFRERISNRLLYPFELREVSFMLLRDYINFLSLFETQNETILL